MSNKGKENLGGSVAEDSQTVIDSHEFTGNPMGAEAFKKSGPLDPDTSYKMDNKRRGKALIFNQEHFYWRLELQSREGTNADRDKLEKSLKALNFDVEIYNNSKMIEVYDKICEAAESDHSNADCFLMVFLSHGENDHVYTYDGKLSIRDITARFKGDKCRSLVGKPKIFILQACRGDMHDIPVMACDAVDSELKSNEVVADASALYTIPAGADFIMCYSVAEGYFSHRNTLNGSWYIQDLCALLQEYGDKLEFTELLTLVNRKVSMRSVGFSNDLNSIGKKQVPCFASMLTKKLYFGGSK